MGALNALDRFREAWDLVNHAFRARVQADKMAERAHERLEADPALYAEHVSEMMNGCPYGQCRGLDIFGT